MLPDRKRLSTENSRLQKELSAFPDRATLLLQVLMSRAAERGFNSSLTRLNIRRTVFYVVTCRGTCYCTRAQSQWMLRMQAVTDSCACAECPQLACLQLDVIVFDCVPFESAESGGTSYAFYVC